MKYSKIFSHSAIIILVGSVITLTVLILNVNYYLLNNWLGNSDIDLFLKLLNTFTVVFGIPITLINLKIAQDNRSIQISNAQKLYLTKVIFSSVTCKPVEFYNINPSDYDHSNFHLFKRRIVESLKYEYGKIKIDLDGVKDVKDLTPQNHLDIISNIRPEVHHNVSLKLHLYSDIFSTFLNKWLDIMQQIVVDDRLIKDDKKELLMMILKDNFLSYLKYMNDKPLVNEDIKYVSIFPSKPNLANLNNAKETMDNLIPSMNKLRKCLGSFDYLIEDVTNKFIKNTTDFQ